MKTQLTEREQGRIKLAFVENRKKKSLVKMCSCIAQADAQDNGEKVYITAEWMDQNPDEIYFEVTSESLYDFLVFKRDDIEVLDEIREELIEEYYSMEDALSGRFEDICEELAECIADMLEEQDAEADRTKW